MGANNLNLSLKISALVEGVDKIRELAKAISDATKGQSGKADTSAQSALTAAATEAAQATKVLGEETRKTTDAVKEGKKPIGESAQAILDLNDSVQLAVKGLKFLAGGFLGLKAVQIAKDFADTAARTETLGVVLNTVGRNAGYTSDQLADADKAVQKLGITASSSRESLTKLIQSGIDLSFGPKLARAAQDLAVVSGENSSATLSRLITNIQQMDTTGLRFMGIVIDREAVMQKAAQETGKAVSASAAKVVFANAVLAEATKLTGIYEESLNTVGKQLTSLPRYVENFKVALGNTLLPVYLALVQGATRLLVSLNDLAKSFVGSSDSVDRLHSSLQAGSEAGGVLAEGIRTATDAVVGFITFIKENLEVIKSLVFYLSAAYAAFKLLSIVGAITAAIVPVATAIGTFVGWIISAIAAVRAFAAAATIVGAALGFAFGPVTVTIAAITLALTAAAAAYKLLFGKSKQDAQNAKLSIDEVTKAVNDYTASLDNQTKLREGLLESARAEATLANKLSAAQSSGDAKRIKEAQEALSAQSKKTDAIKAQIKTEEAAAKILDAKLTQAQKEKQITEEQFKQIDAAKERSALAIKAVNLEQIARDELVKSLKDAGIDFQAFATGVETSFSTAADGIVLGSQSIKIAGVDAADGVRALIDRLEKLAEQTKTPEELIAFAKALGAVQEASAKAADAGKIRPDQALSAALAARIQAEANRRAAQAQREREAGGAQALAQANALANSIQESIVARSRNIADLAKAQGDRALAEQQRQYDLGLVSTEVYYRQKLLIASKNAANELAVEEAVLQQLRVKQRQATDPAQAKSAQTAVATQEAKIGQLRVKQAADIEAQLGEQRAKEIATLKAVTDQSLKNAAAADDTDLISQIAIINRQYEDQLVSLKAIGNADQINALAAERDQKIRQARLDIENKQLQRRLDLGNADLDQQQAKLSLAQKQGDITDTQAQNASNDIISRRISLQQAQRQAVSEQLAREQASVLAGTGASVQSVAELQLKLIQLDNEILNLSLSTKTYAESIRTNFTDALAAGIDSVISKGATLRQAFQDIGRSVRAQLSQIVSKDIAQSGVKLLVDLTGGKGNSIFDKLGGLLGDKKGDSPLNPLYVVNVGAGGVKDIASLVGTTGAGGTTGSQGIFAGFTDGLKSFFNSFGNIFKNIFSSIGSIFSGGSGGGGILSSIASFFGFKNGGLVTAARALPRFGWGGRVRGPGTATSDSILARLSDGEYVIKAPAVAQWGTQFLDFINGDVSRPTSPAYAEGGPVRRFGVQGDMSSGGAGGVTIERLTNNIDSRTDTAQVQQLIAQGVRQGIRQYHDKLVADGKIR